MVFEIRIIKYALVGFLPELYQQCKTKGKLVLRWQTLLAIRLVELNDYPALYQSADISSSKAQSTYLRLFKLHYALLVVTAVVATMAPVTTLTLIVYALFVSSSTGLLTTDYMVHKKPENDWYVCRALAESIKTATWRYMMRAEPFEDTDCVPSTQTKFSECLQQILKSNKDGVRVTSHNPILSRQISEFMSRIRSLPLNVRIEKYKHERIEDQRIWYLNNVKK